MKAARDQGIVVVGNRAFAAMGGSQVGDKPNCDLPVCPWLDVYCLGCRVLDVVGSLML
jgi:hypothetical protein